MLTIHIVILGVIIVQTIVIGLLLNKFIFEVRTLQGRLTKAARSLV